MRAGARRDFRWSNLRARRHHRESARLLSTRARRAAQSRSACALNQVSHDMAVFDRIAVSSTGQAAMRAAHSPRALAGGLLALALVLGVVMRFQMLGLAEFSADEGASWTAASAPDVSAVVAMEHQLDPGKLPLYDLLLHGWIRIFGDSVGAMRGMS